jgi:Phosphotransferase enzyme family
VASEIGCSMVAARVTLRPWTCIPASCRFRPPAVRALVAEQFPQWQQLHIQAVPSPGTVNAIFRIGERFVARFPLQPDDGAAVGERLQREAAAAEELTGQTPFATPRPIAIGEPGIGYPLPWSMYTWLPGEPTTAEGSSESDSFATDLSEFIAAVRTIDTRGRIHDGNGRGGELFFHDDWMQECLTHCEGLLDVATLRASPRSGQRLAPFGCPASPTGQGPPRLRRRGMAARTGVGLPAGDGCSLVLPRHQPDHERWVPVHPRTYRRRHALLTAPEVKVRSDRSGSLDL